MQARYDPEADVLFVELRPAGPTAGEPLDDRRILHREKATGAPVAVEFLFASRGIDTAGVPERERIDAALRAFRTALSVA